MTLINHIFLCFTLIFHSSLDAYLGDLHATLEILDFPFQIIGAGETSTCWIQIEQLPVQMQFTFTAFHSTSAAGGVALYASKPLNAVKRTDLSISDTEFETVWIEIRNSKLKNILCCCAYRHPSSSPERFTDHMDTILHNLARENKNIFILGDFY